MRRLVYDAVIPELEAVGLPTIDVRLGLDGGETAIVVLSSAKGETQIDAVAVARRCR